MNVLIDTNIAIDVLTQLSDSLLRKLNNGGVDE